MRPYIYASSCARTRSRLSHANEESDVINISLAIAEDASLIDDPRLPAVIAH
jgi:hypothetical protein